VFIPRVISYFPAAMSRTDVSAQSVAQPEEAFATGISRKAIPPSSSVPEGALQRFGVPSGLAI
jgi:hypothetical protein